MDLLSYGFIQRALVAGMLVAVVCGVVSVFVVLRRLAFIGVGISHSAFGGVALGVLLGLEPTLAAVVFALVVALGIGWVSYHQRVEEDTAIGIFEAAAMAAGLLFLGFSKSYNVDLFGYLFGNILAVEWRDIWVMCGLAVVVLGFVGFLFKELLYISFDAELALASGLPVEGIYYSLLAVLALAIVVCMKLVGAVLVAAMLVLPAATGLQLTANYRLLFPISLFVAVLACGLGLFLSWQFDLAPGASIVLVATLFFSLAIAVSKWLKK